MFLRNEGLENFPGFSCQILMNDEPQVFYFYKDFVKIHGQFFIKRI